MKILNLCAFFMAVVAPFISSAPSHPTNKPVAADFFNSAPSELVSYLTPVNRLDMIDYFNSGSTVGTENRLGSKVRILSMDDKHVRWEDDCSVTTTIVVLPFTNSILDKTLLILIRTFNGNWPDSKVSYYENDWSHPLDPNDNVGLPNPKLKDWLVNKDKNTRAEVAESIPFMLYTAEYDLECDILIFTNRMADFFRSGDTPPALKKLKPELGYFWEGYRFVWMNPN